MSEMERITKYMDAMFEPGYMQRDLSHLVYGGKRRPVSKTTEQSPRPEAVRGKTIILINNVNIAIF